MRMQPCDAALPIEAVCVGAVDAGAVVDAHPARLERVLGARPGSTLPARRPPSRSSARPGGVDRLVLDVVEPGRRLEADLRRRRSRRSWPARGSCRASAGSSRRSTIEDRRILLRRARSVVTFGLTTCGAAPGRSCRRRSSEQRAARPGAQPGSALSRRPSSDGLRRDVAALEVDARRRRPACRPSSPTRVDEPVDRDLGVA